MMYDICRSTVSLSCSDSLQNWNDMILAFLSHGTATPTHLGLVLSAEPDFAMGHAARGLFSLMMGRAELVSVAQEAALVARRSASSQTLSFREDRWIRALELWLDGSPSGAVDAMEEILSRNPADTLSAKVSHGINFILGDHVAMRSSIERVLDAHGPDHPCGGYVLGCHAFALEETGAFERAERTGREGLARASNDAWGLHAVAHVYDMTARPSLGIALIAQNGNAWEHCNNFRYHVWWHKALLHLDRGEIDVALGLYDAQIRADKTDDYRDIANATSLLTRLELEGVKVGRRWDELADFAANRTGDGCLVFADLHYMLALTGANRPEARQAMADRFARDAARGGEMNARVSDPGLAALSGLTAFAEGRYNAAFTHLTNARPRMQTIGGSHAQRDVFDRMTIDAGLRAGRLDETQAILEDRMARRGGTEDRFCATRFASMDRVRRIPAE